MNAARWMRMVPALAFATAAFAEAPVAEVFVDSGKTYVRAGSDQGLKVGSSVSIVDATAERKALGSASVLEVFPEMARVSLDKAAAQASGDKYAVLPGKKKAAETAAAPAAKGTPAAQPAAAAGSLKGHASLSGVGPEATHKMVLFNDGDVAWSHCELRLPNNKRYLEDHLRAHDSESIMLFKFNQDGPEYDRALDSLSVKCAEGETKMNFSM